MSQLAVIIIFERHFLSEKKSGEEKKNAKIRNRYNQVPHLTQDTIREVTKTQGNISAKARLLTGDHKAARNRQDSMVKTYVKHK